LLRRKGLYTVHAAAVEKNGYGLLIPGSSGQGKTTACIALLRAGYRYLSDDHPFVRRNGSRFELLSFPVKVDVTEQSVAFFPELRDGTAQLHQGLSKQFFSVEDLYPAARINGCEPAFIVFPYTVDEPQSYLEPLSKSRAFVELLSQCLLVYDKEVAKREFQTWSGLVERAECYRLYFGRDVLELPRLIDPLFEKVVPVCANRRHDHPG
jgi:hypothetical protein